jgi:organic hydroperoxide reductase OsmC/OhrA
MPHLHIRCLREEAFEMAQHEYTATVSWSRGDGPFLDGKYSRAHTWSFDGGLTVPASSSPLSVRVPLSNPANIDPEEALVAAASSCHMLTFLWLAQREGFQIDRYEDRAVATGAKNEAGAAWISTITLRPAITWGGDKRPTADDLHRLHHRAHEQCIIANSIKSEVKVEPL